MCHKARASLSIAVGAVSVLAVVTPAKAATVAGDNPAWTWIGSVPAGQRFTIQATGTVNFGCRSGGCQDEPDAGVQGNGLWAAFQAAFGGNWEDTIANPWNWRRVLSVMSNFANDVRFDQGGVFVKVVKHGTEVKVTPTMLWYYWKHGLNRSGVQFDFSVDVYAVTHDGGRDPDRARMGDYTDNSGSYDLSISACGSGVGGRGMALEPTEVDAVFAALKRRMGSANARLPETSVVPVRSAFAPSNQTRGGESIGEDGQTVESVLRALAR